MVVEAETVYLLVVEVAIHTTTLADSNFLCSKPARVVVWIATSTTGRYTVPAFTISYSSKVKLIMQALS